MPIYLDIPILVKEDVLNPNKSVWAIISEENDMFIATYFRQGLESGLVQDMAFTREMFDNCVAWDNIEGFLKYIYDNFPFADL